MINKIEALADAIAYHVKSHEPASQAYKNRNPGNLRAVSLKHPRDPHGFRVFNSHLDGYQALLFDLRVKLSGKSRARLNSATLNDLITAYGLTRDDARGISRWLTYALDPTIAPELDLAYFLE